MTPLLHNVSEKRYPLGWYMYESSTFGES
jgi:hypothetical protein